jgi:2-polyprenyl-3-methyl-5-hydroxy-6-metoxy-1,4-benzoquinol methylase/DNA-binding transcriptional ArsR family regulator
VRVRLGLVPENPVEWVVLRLGLGPQPLIETHLAYTLARAVMLGTKLGLFDALIDGEATAEQIAKRLDTEPRATEKLMFALAGAGYLAEREGGRYALTPMSRKWLARSSPLSLADKMLFQFIEWDWLEESEHFVATGKPLAIHQSLDEQGWDLYQRAMRAMAAAFSKEGVRRMPIPKHAHEMLDIGGSHGLFSVALCRRHKNLRATILDLPDAVEKAAPLLAAEGMGERVVHRAGDALVVDLGAERYDLVLIAQLVHHFSAEQNIDLARRVGRALRPGGVFAILDALRAPSARKAGQVPALLDFYFALTSASGTWAPKEMASWQREAGLRPRRPIRFREVPGAGIQAAGKPA